MSIGNLENEGDLQRFIERTVNTPGVLPPAAESGSGGTYNAGNGITLTGGDTFNADFGTGSGKVTEGNDARLSDARTPTAHTHAQSDVTGLTTDLANKQPLDADLTAIAGVATDPYGRGLLALANISAALTYLGAVGTSDSRLTDSRTPSGSASGDLTGTYPSPTIGAGKVTAAKASTGTGSTNLAVGNDGRFPTAGEKSALAGTSGTPGSGNKYVTDTDSRLSNARTPTGTASGDLTGTYPSPTVKSSVNLSGNPTAPTQTAGNNSTRLATTAYADGAVATASTADRARANHTGSQAQSTVVNLVSDLAAKAPLANPTFTGNVVVPDGGVSSEAVNLGQLDSAIAGAKAGQTFKPACRWVFDDTALPAHTRSGDVLTATSNGILYSDPSGFGVPQMGERVLVVNATGAHRGIYITTSPGTAFSPWVLTRAPDAVNGALSNGAFVTVLNAEIGSLDSTPRDYILTTPDPIVVNTTSQTWEKIAPSVVKATGAFRGYASSHGTVATGTDVVFAANAESFDPDGWLDTSTNKGRYKPLKPGYYRFSAGINFSTTLAAARFGILYLAKNGSRASQLGQTPPAVAGQMSGSDVLYMDGSTDYAEIFIRHNHTAAASLVTGATGCYFSGEFIGS
jgi:hypothetical protein